MNNVAKNAEDIYRLRNKRINEIKRARKKQAKEDDEDEEDGEDEEPDLTWTHKPYNEVEKLVSGNINMIRKIKDSDNTSYIRLFLKIVW